MENRRKAVCHYCGEELSFAEERYFNGRVYCEDCLDQITVLCDRCGERIYSDNAYYADDDDYDEIPLCHRCYRAMQTDYIRDYSYKPEPIFYGNGERFFGVELEIDGGGKNRNHAKELLELLPRNTAYIKSDGSLDDGMEIVTHPMTLQYHQETFLWQELVKEALALGYYSHKTDTCGLHIHVNRSSLGETITEQEETISRILYFVETYWNEMLKFSRRTAEQMKRWAARYGRKDTPQEVMQSAKIDTVGRYSCVNLLNSQTIEFRIFRGTLRYNTLIAALQFVNALCNLALVSDNEEMTEMTWCDFMAGLDKERYAELIQYLKERRLYINESVTVEEEA